MERVLFIDRDGTIIHEPESDEQVDSIDKFAFLPGVLKYLGKISNELEFTLVMVSNQDGLGTEVFPSDTFWPLHKLMMRTLESEGIRFADVRIDVTYPEANAPTRKPGTAMLTAYMNGSTDLENSFVIGDRESDVELAKNLGSKSIFISAEQSEGADLSSDSWEGIYNFLKNKDRISDVSRETNETEILIEINLDGSGQHQIKSGIGFFDHMLDQLAKHSGCDINIEVKGDLHVDEHHTIEDTALALGDVFSRAMGKKKGLTRYAFDLPMDESEARVSLDFSGRPWLEWNVEFKREHIGECPTEMFSHFFRSFCQTSGCTMHVEAKGENEHHKIEAIFKAVGRCIRQAVARDPENTAVPSTKGIL